MSKKTMRIGDYEIDIHHIRWVEGELRRHFLRKRRLRMLEAAILHETQPIEPGMPRGSGVGDPTQRKALELAELSARIMAIDETYATLPPLQQHMVKVLYFDNRQTIDGIAMDLEVDRKTVIRHRNRALTAFALVLLGDWVTENGTKKGLS